MSFFGVQEIIENCNYLTALNEEKGASTEILDSMLPYSDPRVNAVEERLGEAGALNFDTIFSESNGYYLFSEFLREGYGVDKAMFLKDVGAYKKMTSEPARYKVAKLMFDRYLTPNGLNRSVTVFGAISQRNRERRSQDVSNGKIPLSSSMPNMAGSASNNKVNQSRGVMSGRDEQSSSNLDTITEKESETKETRQQRIVRRRKDRDHRRSFGGDVPNNSLEKSESWSARNKGKENGAADGPNEKDGSGDNDGNNDGNNNRKGEPSVSLSETGTAAAQGGDRDQDNASLSGNALDYDGPEVRNITRVISTQRSPKDLFRPLANMIKQELIDRAFPVFLKSKHFQTYVRSKQLEEQAVGVEDFATLRLLGRGGFGTVYASRKLDSGRLYAMKAISKKLIKWKKAVSMTMLERHCLALVESPFVCNLAYAFQDKTHLFLIMDLMAGGDLKFHLTKQKGPRPGFSEDRTKFHSAEILLALDAMHKKDIIFRDLKLENVLLDESGHCKISDLGLVALQGKKRITHYAGTPGYIAPEVAQKIPYGTPVDFFSYGVTIYRMLSGKKPFKGSSRQEFDKAVCEDEPVYDRDVFSPEATSLIKGLLRKDPKKRLGCGPAGVQEIKDHPFFADIDWGLLEIGYLDPPFVPSKHDVNANSLEDIGVDDESKQYSKVHLDDKFKKQIQGFEYVSKHSVRREIVAALKRKRDDENMKRLNKERNGGANNCCCVIQ